MPEGPEVRIAADKIQRAIGQSPLVDCTFLTPLFRYLSISLITALNCLRLIPMVRPLCCTCYEVSLYVHLQLYGRWRTGTLKSFSLNRTLRFKLCTETHYALYTLPQIWIS